MKEILVAYNHICVDRTDKKDHEMTRAAILFPEGTKLADEIVCKECGRTVKKGPVTTGFYSEGTV